MKICTKCKNEKLLNEFHKDKRSNDGLMSWCKSCRSNYNKSINNNQMPLQKQCFKCGLKKDSNQFYKDKRSNDGLVSWCKSCRSKNQKEYRREKIIQELLRERGIDEKGQPYNIDLTQKQICNKCSIEKELKEFYYIRKSKKHDKTCKSCRKVINKESQKKILLKKIRVGQI